MRRLAVVLLVSLLLAGTAAAEEVLFHEGGVLVTREGPYRILKFRGPDGDVEQSRCDEHHPQRLFHEYTRMQLLGLLYVPQPRSVLVVGLGGASLTRALAAALPETRIDSVEIEPAVVEAARRFFFYREGPRVRTVIQDARSYLEHTDQRYDLVFLDAFDGDEIPYPLRTVEFYRSVRGALNPGGAAVANLIHRSPLYPRDRRTLAEVFPCTTAFTGLGNVIVVGTSETREPTMDEARALDRRFGEAYLLSGYFEVRSREPDWPPDTAVLTDER